MPKACLNCGTENRDEALFCRRCGNPFSAEHASPSTSEPTMPGSRAPAAVPVPPAPPAPPVPRFPSPAPSVFDADDDEERTVLPRACAACGFANRPGAPVCAKCGSALTTPASASSPSDNAATLIMPRAPLPAGTSVPPPEDRTTVAYVAPSATAVAAAAAEGSAAPGAPHDRAATSTASADVATVGGVAGRSASSRPIGLWLAIAVAAVLLIVAGYWFLNPPAPQPIAVQDPPSPPASAPASSAPVAETPPPPAEALPPPMAAPSTGTAASMESSAPLAAASEPASAAEDAARAAKEKADRLARAKAFREQREQAAAAKKAEQDAAAQRVAEEKALSAANSSASAPRASVPVTSVTQAQSAQEKCAGRGAIGTAVCESRECGKPEHVNESRCRQVNADEERRR